MERNIDIVIPMVFPQDPVWQREYHCAHSGNAAHNVRFRSWATEELLVRCCEKYMPWARDIILLLSGESQVQQWMKASHPDGPNIRIVLHREFVPSKFLPCFSAPCFEMFLDRIPGLSEWFIYGNDDMFPLSPLHPEDFFRKPADGDGSHPLLPCQIMTEMPYPVVPNIFHRGCMQGLNMIAEPYGLHFRNTWLKNGHSMAAYLRSSCEEVLRRHGEQIMQHINPLKRDEHSNYQYIYAYYQHFAGLYVSHTPRLQYVGPDVPTKSLPAILRDPEAGIVCLNDNAKITDWQQRAAVVRREIMEKLDG